MKARPRRPGAPPVPAGLALAALLALSCAAAAEALAQSADARLASRAFTIRYRGLDDVVALIQPAVSEQGSYAVQPRIKTVTVTDTAESLRRIEELIAGFDLPPRAVQLVVQLMRAEEGPPQPRPARRLGLPPAVIQDVTKWGVITPLGGASLSTAENASGSVALGEEFQVQFRVGAAAAGVGIIRLERFALERARRGADGAVRHVPVIDLVLNLKDGVTTVLGATSSQDSKQALFVSVTARLVEP